MAKYSNYRIPPEQTIKIGANDIKHLQVNFCKNTDCDNFGIPAKVEHIKRGPSNDRDPHYKVTSTSKGQIPAIVCKCCNEKIPIKSNKGIAEEFARITQPMLTLEEKNACRTEDCSTKGLSVAEYPKRYQKAGMQAGTKLQMYRCKECNCRMTLSNPLRIYPKTKHLAADLFSRVVNKSPVRGTVRGLGLKSPGTYYSIMDFITRQCDQLSGIVDRRLIDGQLRLPTTMKLSVDVQEYKLNWTNKEDRRNTLFSTVCSVDQESRFIFGMCANYDKEADAFAINKQAALNNDIGAAEAFREHAQYWLEGDELGGNRRQGKRLPNDERQAVLQQIAQRYVNAQTREDIENREEETLDTDYCNPIMTNGMQVHVPYTSYAHFQLMQQILKGSGVTDISYSMDFDSMLRAGFMSAFHQEIEKGQAQGFYIRYEKYLTKPKKKELYQQAKDILESFRASLPFEQQQDAERLLMEKRIEEARQIGKWKDRWVLHPLPSMNQPEKAICWLTDSSKHKLDNAQIANLHLGAGINAVDNVFQISRRLMNAFERPIGTSSGYNTVWHGYAPYNPKMVEQYLSLLRTYHNFIKTGDDGTTPAMRLGITKKPLSFDDVLWPGQKIPQAPRKRRKGTSIDNAINKTSYDDGLGM